MRTGEGGVRSTGVEGRPGGLEAAGLGCVLGMRAWDAGRARGACAVHFSLCMQLRRAEGRGRRGGLVAEWSLELRQGGIG